MKGLPIRVEAAEAEAEKDLTDPHPSLASHSTMEFPNAVLVLLGGMAAYVRVHIAWHPALAHGLTLLDVRPWWTPTDAVALRDQLSRLPSAVHGTGIDLDSRNDS